MVDLPTVTPMTSEEVARLNDSAAGYRTLRCIQTLLFERIRVSKSYG